MYASPTLRAVRSFGWRRLPDCCTKRVMSSTKRQKLAPKGVVILTGPTAVGKTELSLKLAERLDGEIISADSVQVYRALDIGSDKIEIEQRRGVPHHLLDIKDAHEDFSAGLFHDLAWEAVTDILQRGRVPIVVGGTGLYLDWFMRGKPGTPVSTEETAKRAQARLKEKWDAVNGGQPLSPEAAWAAGCDLVEELGDSESASRLLKEPGNTYRLERVVEILLSSPGCKLSDFSPDGAASEHEDIVFHPFFLYRPRIELYRRIDARVEQMVERGILQEAAMLLRSGLTPDRNCATRAIGYRQAMLFLQSCLERPEPITAGDLAKLVFDVQSATRKLCHRQMTWFRKKQEFDWLDATLPVESNVETILSRIGESEALGSQHAARRGELTAAEQYELKRYQSLKTGFGDPQSEMALRVVSEANDLLHGLRTLDNKI